MNSVWSANRKGLSLCTMFVLLLRLKSVDLESNQAHWFTSATRPRQYRHRHPIFCHRRRRSTHLVDQDSGLSSARGHSHPEGAPFCSFSAHLFSGSREQDDNWVEEAQLDEHRVRVRGMAWAPTFHFHRDQMPRCSQEGHI